MIEKFIKMDNLEALKRILKSMYYLKKVSNLKYANQSNHAYSSEKLQFI